MRVCALQLYRACEDLTAVLTYLLVVFTPWAFGTTQSWAVWTVNIAGYVLGLLLVLKLAIRRFQQYHPARWEDDLRAASSRPTFRSEPRLTAALIALTLLSLGYCLLSAINARATFDDRSLTFEYRDCIRWLPHSLDAGGTWLAFWGYLGLACSFWAVRDWLLGRSDRELRVRCHRRSSGTPFFAAQEAGVPGEGRPAAGSNSAVPFPARLHRLLWLLALNGALLGVESIVQRSVGSPKLLFLVKPRIHQTAESQFGPYAYRSNAAQYFNLVWPVALGFWWTLNRRSAPRSATHHILLGCAAIMAACPVISTSRGGALVMLGMVGLTAGFIAVSQSALMTGRAVGRRRRSLTLMGLGVFFAVALGLGLSLGGNSLKTRMDDLRDGLEGREELYASARPMAADYPWFGTGPGTFETVSQLYLRPHAYRRPQLHNDWLETRITFGWCGSALVALAFGVVLARSFAGGGIHAGKRFVLLCWLAVAGCLVHARFDFPFQVHSVVFLVVVIGAVLFCISRRG